MKKCIYIIITMILLMISIVSGYQPLEKKTSNLFAIFGEDNAIVNNIYRYKEVLSESEVINKQCYIQWMLKTPSDPLHDFGSERAVTTSAGGVYVDYQEIYFIEEGDYEIVTVIYCDPYHTHKRTNRYSLTVTDGIPSCEAKYINNYYCVNDKTIARDWQYENCEIDKQNYLRSCGAGYKCEPGEKYCVPITTQCWELIDRKYCEVKSVIIDGDKCYGDYYYTLGEAEMDCQIPEEPECENTNDCELGYKCSDKECIPNEIDSYECYICNPEGGILDKMIKTQECDNVNYFKDKEDCGENEDGETIRCVKKIGAKFVCSTAQKNDNCLYPYNFDTQENECIKKAEELNKEGFWIWLKGILEKIPIINLFFK